MSTAAVWRGGLNPEPVLPSTYTHCAYLYEMITKLYALVLVWYVMYGMEYGVVYNIVHGMVYTG